MASRRKSASSPPCTIAWPNCKRLLRQRIEYAYGVLARLIVGTAKNSWYSSCSCDACVPLAQRGNEVVAATKPAEELMATNRKRKTVTRASRNPKTRGKRVEVAERYRSDKPAGADAPGTGQPGDEVVTPAERERAEELAAEAIEAGTVVPPQPLGVPVEEQTRPGASQNVEREVEDQLNHAGVEDEPEQHENE